jgi:hypothetical protein
MGSYGSGGVNVHRPTAEVRAVAGRAAALGAEAVAHDGVRVARGGAVVPQDVGVTSCM